jgi:hypothetical protein
MSEIEDKDKIVDVASEPAVSYALNDCLNSETEIDYEFHGRDFGYARTLEELELALDEADEERNDPSKWITPVEFHTRLEKKYSWLR